MKQQLKAHEKTHEGKCDRVIRIRGKSDAQRTDIHALTLLTRHNRHLINGHSFNPT